MKPGTVIGFDDQAALGQALAAALGVPWQQVQRHRFPDGEVKLTLPATLPEEVVLLRGLHQPNHKLVEALIAGPAARDLGARRVVLVAPYLAYMRQDIAFSPGEAVSQRHIAGLLARVFDAVVTVDPHLHRIASLDEVMPGSRGVAVSAAALLGRWVAAQVDRPLLLGPDAESAQWVQAAAAPLGLDHAACVKRRDGDRDVHVTLPPRLALAGRGVVLVDDMASTGRTLMEAAQLCRAAGAATVDVAVTHALFVGDALSDLRDAGVRHVWSTDAVPHASNVVGIAATLADALHAL